MSHLPLYDHTQRAPLGWMLYGVAIVDFVVVAWAIGEPSGLLIAGTISGLLAVLASCFHYVRVTDLGDRLEIGFGPTPLFRRTIRYADMRTATVDRTTLLEGWGIHMSPRGGWIWNLWGRACVTVTTTRSTLRIGTDDAAGLAGFLENRTKRLAEV